MTEAPRIETERLVLRMPGGDDWEVWADFVGSERARYVGGPMDRDLAWRSFAQVIGHWTLRGWGSFVITRRGHTAPLGLTGPWYPHGWPEHEIGWTIWSADAEGRGYAFEAAAAARRFAYERLGWTTAVSYIDPANDRSIALARRLGAVEDPHAARKDADDLVFRHPAPEAVA
jgi:RimJ/RimL family protein N-acetyltransferase